MIYKETYQKYSETLREIKIRNENDMSPVTIVRNHFVTEFRHWKLGGQWLAFLCLDTEVPEEINTNHEQHGAFMQTLDAEVGHGETPNIALYDLYKKLTNSWRRK